MLQNALRLVNPAGRVSVIGFFSRRILAKNEKQKQGIYEFPFAELFDKGITIGTGQAPVKKYNEYLRGLITSGGAKPSRIVSHHIHIADAPEEYEKFDQREDSYTKVLIKFPQAA